MMNTLSAESPRTRAVSERGFLVVSALLFIASAGATAAWSESMPTRHAMPMWMPMCGQTWTTLAASFIGMWTVMMVAMMLPSLVPMLWRYRKAVGDLNPSRLDVLTVLVGIGYFAVWVAMGGIAFALGAWLTALEMAWPLLARVVPIGAGIVVLAAGALQFSAWKARHLIHCQEAPRRGSGMPADVRTALRYGLRLGLYCSGACASLTVILLVAGAMDLGAMAAVTAAITLERHAPACWRVAHAVGGVAVCFGVLLMTQAVMAG